MVNAEGSMQEKSNSSAVRHLGGSLGLAGSWGVSPLGTITFDRPPACTNWPLVPAMPLGSAGLRYVNVRQITCRERKLALVNKNQVRLELSEEGNIAPLCISQNRGFALTLVVLVTPLQAIRTWALSVAKAESSLLALLLHLDALHLLSNSRVHFLFRVKTLEYR